MTYDVTYMRCVCVFPLYRQAWDLAVDICLSQLPTIIEEGTAFRVSVCVRETNKHRATDASDASCCYVFWH